MSDYPPSIRSHPESDEPDPVRLPNEWYIEASVPLDEISRLVESVGLSPTSGTSPSSLTPPDSLSLDALFTSGSRNVSVEEIQELVQDPRIRMAAPVYRYGDDNDPAVGFPSSRHVLVRFTGPLSDDRVRQLEADFLVSLQREVSRLLAPVYRFTVLDPNDADQPAREPSAALTIATALNDEADVAFAYVPMAELDALSCDQYTKHQWNLAAINHPAAWGHVSKNVRKGISFRDWLWKLVDRRSWTCKQLAKAAASLGQTTIAVVDTGVETGHPDLQLTKNTPDHPSHFNYKDVWSSGPHDANPNFPDPNASHGTAVAGIAAATPFNGKGITGVTVARIMPVRVTSNATVEYSDLAAGIAHAIDKGARVINVSISKKRDEPIVAEQIRRARQHEVVVCAAAGNRYKPAHSATARRYPAAYPTVISVGAVDRTMRRKELGSGEAWESMYNDTLTVVAPGINLWAPDTHGTTGYNKDGGPMGWFGVNYRVSGDQAGSYFALFGMTSGATPQVAGLAALLLSLDPSATAQEVTNRIIEAADLGPYPDAATGSTPWNAEVGFGLINVEKSAIAALGDKPGGVP